MEEIAKGNDEIKKETYLNRETLEFLTDATDILYYKNFQNDEIVDNQLLGQFDSFGNYSINKEILLELVAIKKVIKESKDNKYVLLAKTKEGFDEILFTLQIDDEGDKKLATLKIIETDVKSNGTKEFLKTTIARYKDDNDTYFMLKVKKVFNIVDGGEGDVINNEELLKIILKKFQDFKSLKKEEGKFDDVAKKYIEKILEILKNNTGKYSEYILRHYAISLEEMKDLVGKPRYYKLLRTRLDNIIDQTNRLSKDPAVSSLIAVARKEFLIENKKIQEDILIPKPIAVKAVSKEKPKEKKVEESKPAKKSSPANKKVEAKKKPAKKAEAGNYPIFKSQSEPKKIELPKIEVPETKMEVKEPLDTKDAIKINFMGIDSIPSFLSSIEVTMGNKKVVDSALNKINSAPNEVQNLNKNSLEF